MQKTKQPGLRVIIPLGTAAFLLLALLGGLAVTAEQVSAASSQNSEAGEAAFTHRILLPIAMNRSIGIDLNVVGTTDAAGAETRGFGPGEALFFSLSGLNPANTSAYSEVLWSQEGPCLPAQDIYTGTLEMKPGSWSFWKVGIAPDCLGVFTHTLQFSFQGITQTVKTNYAVLQPSVNLVDTVHAFDKCNAPSLAQLKAWWKDSPYRSVNFYMGGVSRYCSNLHLDAVWLYQASQMGWTFIPTWVGPQAPCTNYKYRMSSNASTAYQEGRSEARAATAAARRLGLLEERTIYYDIESYRYKITGCSESVAKTAVSSFMRGWTEQLHELGLMSGAYGSPTGSFMEDWGKLASPPDHIWFTHWYTDTFDAQATVWYTSTASYNLSDSLWPNRQRIKQYTNSHYETWGGVTFGIDSNVVDGGLTGVFPPGPVPTGTVTSTVTTDPGIESTIPPSNPSLLAAAPAAPDAGWVIVPHGLLWTEDLGQIWVDRTPPLSLGRPLNAVFWEDGRGLYLAAGEGLETWRTGDGGKTWQAFSLPAASRLAGEEVARAWLGAVDGQQAWIALQMKTGSNWSLGTLFTTYDGGTSWIEHALPVGGQVYFQNATQGWLLGGPGGDELYQTEDAGKTWVRQDAEYPDGRMPFIAGGTDLQRLQEALPGNAIDLQWANDRIGWLTTQDGSCSGYKARAGELPPPGAAPFRCTQETRLWQTLDAGLTWTEVQFASLETER